MTSPPHKFLHARKKGDKIYVCLKVQGTNTATPSEMTFWREGVSTGGKGGGGCSIEFNGPFYQPGTQ